MTTAVVFGYHDVGVRCLEAVVAGGIDVRLVVSHDDDPRETIWFASVSATAARYGIECIRPADPADPALHSRIAAIAPDFIFSFYYRHMLAPRLLGLARRGAYNVHGSLLPRYRGRAPVNWATLHGERETGASLHEMAARPDAGRLVDQLAVPILPNDLAVDVFRKVTVAAETVLVRVLPAIVDGSASPREQDLSRGSYFGGRRPEDGRIDWARGAWQVHNLVRAVAPPYPGAFCDWNGRTLRILQTHWRGLRSGEPGPPALHRDGDRLTIRCADGGLLELLAAELDGAPITVANFAERFGADRAALSST